MSVIEVSTMKPNDVGGFDPRLQRPETLDFSLEQWNELHRFVANNGGASRGINLSESSGFFQPGRGSSIQLFIQIVEKLLGTGSAIPEEKLQRVLDLCRRGLGLKWQKSNRAANPLDAAREKRTVQYPQSRYGAEVQKSIHRPRPNEKSL